MSAVDLSAELERQFTEELGTVEPPHHKRNHKTQKQGFLVYDSGCAACRFSLETGALRQKYGIVKPQLSATEREAVIEKGQTSAGR